MASSSRPDSVVSAASAASSSWSSESSSRPTSYGSDAHHHHQQQPALDVFPRKSRPDNGPQDHKRVFSRSSSPSLLLPTSGPPPRRPGHALMRVRRVSMPDATGVQHLAEHKRALQPAPRHRLSIASARSCESLPEEGPEASIEGMSTSCPEPPEAGPSNAPSDNLILQSAIPVPSRRVRLKSITSRTHAPSSSTSASRISYAQPRRDGSSHNSSSKSRPASLALPTPSALVASSSNGQTHLRESMTLKRSFTARAEATSSTRQEHHSPIRGGAGKGKSSVKFSTPPTRSIISAAAFNTAKKTARLAKKDRIANELLQTERVYVGVLAEIQEHYFGPLQLAATAAGTSSAAAAGSANASASHTPPVLLQRTLRDIFSNFGDVYSLNKEILQLLENSVAAAPVPISAQPAPLAASSIFLDAPPNSTTVSPKLTGSLRAGFGSIRAYHPPAMPIPRNVGTTLIPILPFLKCYSLFVGNFANAQATIEKEERSNEAWKAYVESKKKQGVGKGLSLTAMLLCIVQRIPRYRLLLGDLLRFTDPRDPDYKPLKEAIAAVELVANHLETSIKQHESSVAMLDLQRCLLGLDFQLIVPGRRLLKSGMLVKQGRRTEKERAFFLFTDILVYADIVQSWTLPGLGSSTDGQSAQGHHIHGHSAAPSGASDKSRTSIVWPSNGLPMGHAGAAAQYAFKNRFELEDVTVTSAEELAFELRSTVKSFTLIAATPEIRYEWVTAIREAKHNLLQSRRTLLTDEEEKKRSRLRRLATPANLPSFTRSYSTPVLHVSGPGLGESKLLKTSCPPPPEDVAEDDSYDVSSMIDALLAEDPSDTPQEIGREATDASAPSQRSSYSSHAKYQNHKVYEDYNAPIWVPDSRTAKCMRCNESFALWRRRHHCRLCGDVVCHACSSKSFAVPTADGHGSHCIGRACDECYETCFVDTPEEEIPDPLGASLRSTDSSYSIFDAFNPIKPLITRATSLYDIVGGVSASRSREGSTNSASGLSKSTSEARGGMAGKARESVSILKSMLGQSA